MQNLSPQQQWQPLKVLVVIREILKLTARLLVNIGGSTPRGSKNQPILFFEKNINGIPIHSFLTLRTERCWNRKKALFVWVRLTRNTKPIHKKLPFHKPAEISTPVGRKKKNQCVLPRRSVGGWWQLWPFTWESSMKKVYSNYKGGMLEARWHFFFSFRICTFASDKHNAIFNIEWIRYWDLQVLNFAWAIFDTVSIRIISLIHP